jgi:hypothetical protein
MDVSEARRELQKMGRQDLWELVSAQRISRCLIGDCACGLLVHYKGLNFCISEIMGESCQVERAAKAEEVHEDKKGISYSLPLTNNMRTGPLSIERTNIVEFKVYCRDCATRSIIFLGNILERRTKERRNNLRDLLIKAIEDYINSAADPSTIFLLG